MLIHLFKKFHFRTTNLSVICTALFPALTFKVPSHFSTLNGCIKSLLSLLKIRLSHITGLSQEVVQYKEN